MISTISTKTAMRPQPDWAAIHLNGSLQTCDNLKPTIDMTKKHPSINVRHCRPAVVGRREILLAETGRNCLIQLDCHDYLELQDKLSDSAAFHDKAYRLAFETVSNTLEYSEWVSRTMLLKDIIITLNFLEDTKVHNITISTFYSYALVVIKDIWMTTYKKTEEEFLAVCLEIESKI